MSATRRAWYAEARKRRRLDSVGGALAPTFLGDSAPTPEAAMSMAQSVVATLVDRPVDVGFDRGVSRACVDTGKVVLDRGMLDTVGMGSGDARALRAVWKRIEVMLGVALHEAAHLLVSPPGERPRDGLFRTLQNILEDERIEEYLVRADERFIHPLHTARSELLEPAAKDGRFLHALFTLVRCEGEIPESLWERYRSELEAAIEVLTPFPSDFESIRQASLDLALLVPPEELDETSIETRYIFTPSAGTGQTISGGSGKDADAGWSAGDGPGSASAGAAWPPVVWHDSAGELAAYETARANLGSRPRLLADRLRRLLPPEPSPRQSSGRIDRKRLYAHPFSVRLFRRPVDRRPILSIVLIIDLSGSMSGRSEELASQVATLLCEASLLLPEVELEVYGHSADQNGPAESTTLTRFPADAQGRVLGVATLPVGGNNRDAHAYRVIGDEVNASSLRRSRHRMAILVADGEPHARSFSGLTAREQTRDAIVWLERVWGPVLFIATDEVKALRKMVPGASYRFRSGHAVDELARNITTTLRRAIGGS